MTRVSIQAVQGDKAGAFHANEHCWHDLSRPQNIAEAKRDLEIVALAGKYGTLVYAEVLKEPNMEAQRVGMREFRDKLATYLLESEAPVAITRHGDTVGYFIPARRRRSDAEREALKEASARWQEILDAEGISEGEILADFKKWRAKQKR